MIERILPPEVRSADTRTDPPEAVPLPAEEPCVSRAVESRRREFATVRWCARRALAGLGVAAVPILPGERGAPRWPDGIVGSMTHCAGYRAAAVARSGTIASLGIDAEPEGPLPPGVLDTIAREEELTGLPGGPLPWDRLLFSAKEAVYKAWFPLTGRWLGFEEASLRFDPAGTFTARLLVPGPVVSGRVLDSFTGRWLVDGGLVLSAVVVGRR
ncbi:4'-phosphopantetheinyl transferase superfamily protein [Actinocorallia sp. API 0066]|uniref:4'-phosphopantetheinyl transferase family protein n=1 Tax=Actinocorallia sp. API 0066 TaxID=2896846 RepID=UPI001E3C370F|nr:4'-phosphopantetheinyl transferase superfamily protein [Actinocorallia sp. API 0066]MCD0451733.1 4'-phosphopantetheinyl transferase superfamily protein [Actinocorallia sp. API 0066]